MQERESGQEEEEKRQKQAPQKEWEETGKIETQREKMTSGGGRGIEGGGLIECDILRDTNPPSNWIIATIPLML